MFSRSYKYHRPARPAHRELPRPGHAWCRSATSRTSAARTACSTPGLEVSSQNTWPSLRFDVKAVNGLAGRFLATGFYYKTFIKPERLWPAYEKVLRTFVHAGEVPPDTDRGYYDKRHAHPDVVVAGRRPRRDGRRGGGRPRRRVGDARRGGAPARRAPALGRSGRPGARCGDLRAQVAAQPGIEVLTDSVVAARYDDNWIPIVQRSLPGVDERLIKARAGALVVAPGLIERPYVFAGNDLPGVMLSTAARRLVNL